ncbi:MAG: 2-hydroxychromene-2-carboxylate isomerase [Myxococcales bacterium]|nr:2-hydroxychromene-2-carboxylate isomerase [Myxococcales bacterium]
MATDRAPLRFYFDYISSNAYLAWRALPALVEKHGIDVEPVPVLFAGLLEAHGGLGPAEVPAKVYWMWRNNLRKAALLGIPLRRPAFHPFNPLLALRVTSLIPVGAARDALIDGLMDAIWAESRHGSDPDVVAACADAAGLDGRALVAEAAAPEAKARVRAQTDDAIARGVFGVPSMGVGDELFWGYDDFPYLERYLAGKDPLDPAGMPTGETAPRPSAMRRRFREGT